MIPPAERTPLPMPEPAAKAPHRHLDELAARCPDLAPLRPELERAFEAMRDALRAGGKLLLAGNGGSAADCEHWAGELLKGFESRRPLGAEERAQLPPELADRLQGGLVAIPLTSFYALRTAIANDVAGEMEFAQLAWALGRPGDVFVGISTSGNSRSVCLAAQAARARGCRVVALTGRGGGTLAGLADIALRAPADRTLRVQEFHLPIYHTLSLMLEDAFFPG